MITLQFLPTEQKVDIPDDVYNQLQLHPVTEFRRRSHLFVPLNKPHFFEKIRVVEADGFIMDLEDSIPDHQKDEARKNIAKLPPKPYGIEFVIRVNGHTSGMIEEDLEAIKPYNFDTITIPKVDTPSDIDFVRTTFPDVPIVATIETLKGMHNVRTIADSLSDGDGLGFGAGDFSLEAGIERRSICDCPVLQKGIIDVLLASKERQINSFDTIYRRYTDLDGLRREALFTHRLGATGKKAIHPNQIPIINEIFSPTFQSIERAVRLLCQFNESINTRAISFDGGYEGTPSYKLAMDLILKLFRQSYLRRVS